MTPREDWEIAQAEREQTWEQVEKKQAEWRERNIQEAWEEDEANRREYAERERSDREKVTAQWVDEKPQDSKAITVNNAVEALALLFPGVEIPHAKILASIHGLRANLQHIITVALPDAMDADDNDEAEKMPHQDILDAVMGPDTYLVFQKGPNRGVFLQVWVLSSDKPTNVRKPGKNFTYEPIPLALTDRGIRRKSEKL